MKKAIKNVVILATSFIILLPLVLTGCSASVSTIEKTMTQTVTSTAQNTVTVPVQPSTTEAEEQWITIIDQANKVVKIPKNVKRVVTVPIPFPSVFYTLSGSADMIVGMHPSSLTAIKNSILSKVAPALLDVPTSAINANFEVNIEELLKLKPDVIIDWAWMTDNIAQMESVGIPVISVNYGTQEDLDGWIRIIGQMLGMEDKAARLLEYQHEKLNTIRAISNEIPVEEKPTIYYVYNNLTTTAAGGTYQDVWIEAAGGINVAGVIESPLGTYNVPVTMEQVLAWDPDIIYISNFTNLKPEDFYENNIPDHDVSLLRAVQDHRVYKMPLGIYRWDAPNAESPLMLEWAAMTQQPEYYNFDIRQDMKDFYSEFFNYSLSEAEIDQILSVDFNK